MRPFLTILLVAIASVFFTLSANTFLVNIDANFVNNKFINNLLKYQNFRLYYCHRYFSDFVGNSRPRSEFLLNFGNLETLAIKERWMGIKW
ncbi:MAG: hypothetical protein U5N85_14075 [Arcicella sp.]|nr:hypothetical protein [Arcicella sp.]